ncbi:unnamed protein product [Ascophyllum nodosum]
MASFSEHSGEHVDLLDLGFDDGDDHEGSSSGVSSKEDNRAPAGYADSGNERGYGGSSKPSEEKQSKTGGKSAISFNAAEEERQNARRQQHGTSHGGKFLDNLTDARAVAREYEVVFGLKSTNNGKPDLGLTMQADYHGNRAVVKGFSLVDGKIGPAQACGLICVGDVLVAVGDDRVKGMRFPAILNVVREACRGRGQIRLTFTAGTGEELGPSPQDGAMMEARWFIHQQKARYYRPPPPTEDMVYCSLERHRGERVTSFHLNRDDTGEFLLACSVDSNLHGPMLFHTLQDTHLRDLKDIPTSSDSAVFLGCIIPNLLGNEFRQFDHRVDPRDPGSMEYVKYRGNNELGAVVYDINVMGRQELVVPNAMKVLLKRPVATQSSGADGLTSGEEGEDEGNERQIGAMEQPLIKRLQDAQNKHKPTFRPSSPLKSLTSMWRGAFDDETEAERKERMHYATLSSEGSDIIMFETLKPSWNEVIHAWTLNFNGRVKIPSKKNFLVSPEKGNLAMEQDFGEGKVHLRHGKMSKSRFSVDFRHPISPIVALGVCCSTFAAKVAVT